MRASPTDIAAGVGALWIGNGGGGSEHHGQRLARRSRDRGDHRTVKLPDRPATGRPRIPQLGLPRDRRRRRCGLGDQPRPHHLPDRPRDRQARGDDRRRRRHDRRRQGGRLVHRRRRQRGGHPDRPAHQPRRAADPRRRAEPVRGGRRRRLRLGVRARATASCGGSSPGPARSPDDRRRSRRRRTSPTVRGGLGGELQSTAPWRGSTWRRTTVEATPVGAVQGLAAGEASAWVSTAGRDAGGRAAGSGVRRAGLGRPRARRADRVGPPAPRAEGRGSTGDGGRDPVRAGAARLQGGRALGRLPLVRRLERPDRGLRPPHLRGERQRVRARGAARRGDRHLQLVLRPGRDPDPQPGARRAAGDDQPREHLLRA